MLLRWDNIEPERRKRKKPIVHAAAAHTWDSVSVKSERPIERAWLHFPRYSGHSLLSAGAKERDIFLPAEDLLFNRLLLLSTHLSEQAGECQWWIKG